MKIIPPPRDRAVLRKDYKRVLRIAGDFLAGRVGILGASRALRTVSFYIDAQEEPEFKLFTEIAESSWHLPIGTDREFSSYKGSDEELKAAVEELERKHRNAAMAAAQHLVGRYSTLIEQKAARTFTTCLSARSGFVCVQWSYATDQFRRFHVMFSFQPPLRFESSPQ
jgi:hypothetical protein